MYNSFVKFLKKAVVAVNRLVSVIEWRLTHLSQIVRKRSNKSTIRNVIAIFIAIFLLLLAIFIFWAATLKTPDLSSFDDKLLGQSAKIYDRTGTILLYDLSQKVRRTVTPLENVSPYLKNATVAIEDSDFYNHKGIKYSAILRAILNDVLTLHFSQGGSTITQQVVKNSLLTNKKDISRKIKEWILALKLEKSADKNQILELYLNDTPYGGNIYGVEEASQAYFAKKASDLTLAEAAYIAAMPQAPTLYSPYGKNKNLLVERKNLVLKKMFENNFITNDEYSNAVKEDVTFQPKSVGGIKAPHFVMYIKDYLEQTYGDKLLEIGGLKIVTTLDWEMQQKAEEIVKNYVLKSGPTYKATNGALVATDPKTGQILTMVGSRDYFDKDIDGNFNVATAHRQPGSAFKPFVYATAFNKGLTPETPVYDVPTQFNSSCSVLNQPLVKNANCYDPQNYEGGFKGLMSIRSALGQSRNVPAVRILYVAGVDDSIKTATAMGVNGLGTANDYGLSLALGGAEVSPLDMSASYGVFANNGQKPNVTGILSITNSQGVTLEEYSSSTRQVIPEQTAKLINDVLADPVARASIFGTRYFGDRQVAIKSGTTNDSRDAWIIGYTPSISVAAWMGNNNNTPMAQQASARIIGPMWKGFMDWALENKVPEETFDKPEKDPSASSTKPFLRGVWQGPGQEVHSELYWMNRGNPAGAPPGAASSDSLFNNFEYGVLSWAQSPQGIGLVGVSPEQNPTNSGFSISSPGPNAVIHKNDRVFITVSGITSETTQVEFYINNTLVGKSTEAPFSFSFIPSSLLGLQDEDELRVVATQRVGKYLEAKSYFSLVP